MEQGEVDCFGQVRSCVHYLCIDPFLRVWSA
jgi:hypothetical protein